VDKLAAVVGSIVNDVNNSSTHRYFTKCHLSIVFHNVLILQNNNSKTWLLIIPHSKDIPTNCRNWLRNIAIGCKCFEEVRN